MSRENKFFTTCNGEPVQLSHTQYLMESDFAFTRRFRTLTDMGAKVEKIVMASGGGKPTVYAYAVGNCACGQAHFAERRIERPAHSSNHKCNGKCRAATGHVCECSCKGANHGAN